MTHEFDDPARGEKLDQATRLALRLRAETPSASLENLAARAVGEVFCSRAPGSDDAAENGLSAVRAGLAAEVLRRARIILGQPATSRPGSDIVEVASQDSFPASDPPAWIWRK